MFVGRPSGPYSCHPPGVRGDLAVRRFVCGGRHGAKGRCRAKGDVCGGSGGCSGRQSNNCQKADSNQNRFFRVITYNAQGRARSGEGREQSGSDDEGRTAEEGDGRQDDRPEDDPREGVEFTSDTSGT